jgi:hypothetical protein
MQSSVIGFAKNTSVDVLFLFHLTGGQMFSFQVGSGYRRGVRLTRQNLGGLNIKIRNAESMNKLHGGVIFSIVFFGSKRICISADARALGHIKS